MKRPVEPPAFLRSARAQMLMSMGEQGITTVVVLLILLVLTLIAIAGMTVSTTEIRIAGNQYRAAQGFHAADAGSRVARPTVATQAAMQNPNPGDCFNLNPPIQGIMDTGLKASIVGCEYPNCGARYAVLNACASPQGGYFGKVRGYDQEYQFLDYDYTSTGTGPASTLATADSLIQQRVQAVVPILGLWTQSYDRP